MMEFMEHFVNFAELVRNSHLQTRSRSGSNPKPFALARSGRCADSIISRAQEQFLLEQPPRCGPASKLNARTPRTRTFRKHVARTRGARLPLPASPGLHPRSPRNRSSPPPHRKPARTPTPGPSRRRCRRRQTCIGEHPAVGSTDCLGLGLSNNCRPQGKLTYRCIHSFIHSRIPSFIHS